MDIAVTNTTDASLTAFDPSELFDKGSAISPTVSGLRRTMFEFTLWRSNERSSQRERSDEPVRCYKNLKYHTGES
jgi:hypothetical protein